MRVSRKRLYAVLTGDIVASSRLDPAARRRLPRVLGRIGKDLATWPSVPLPLSRHRGDGWQVIVSEPEQALRAALFVRAALRAAFEDDRVDTRVAIGVGRLDFVPEGRIEDGDGPAYRFSGAALEERSPSHLRIAVHPPRPEIDIILGLVDSQARLWTPSQAAAVLGALTGLTQERIAEKWRGGSISQQAVAQHLRRAGWDAISPALRWFETESRLQDLS